MIKILTEGGREHGFGHIIRCLTLANYCLENDLEYQFYVDGDESAHKIIKQHNGTLVDWKRDCFIKENINHEDTVFVDSYYLTLEHYEIIRKRAEKLLIVDDLYRLPYDGYTIVNPNFCADLLLSDDSKNIYLYGEKYILLRNEFVGKKNNVLNKEVKRVLITFGGSDILDLTPRVITYLRNLSSEITIEVVIGFGYTNLAKIKRVSNVRVNLHYNISANEMAKLMYEVDFGICAAGQTVNEMLKIGCPGCFIKVIDNQQLNIDYFNKSNRGLIFYEDDLSNIKEMFKFEVRNSLKQELNKIKNDSSGAHELYKYIEVGKSGK